MENSERSAHAAALFDATCASAAMAPAGILPYVDNGGSMNGAMMLATLEHLGVLTSFSRPGVSNENSYFEALVQTVKCRRDFPRDAFVNLASAAAWVAAFVAWNSNEH